jgi:uncharacterized RDD family membrane protein YckC
VTAAPIVIVQAQGAARSEPAERYVGLVTRAIAFALDAAIINVVAVLTAAAISLTLSVVKVPHDVRTAVAAVGGVAYVLWTVGYFVTFWSTTGQTPGNRVLRIRVHAASGDRLPPRRAFLRFVGIILATIPLFAGFLPILVDDRRRGLHDMLARTVVLDAEER